jgi:two-component sensor histidine kinase
VNFGSEAEISITNFVNLGMRYLIIFFVFCISIPVAGQPHVAYLELNDSIVLYNLLNKSKLAGREQQARAVQWAKNALEFAEKIQHTPSIAFCEAALGTLYYEQKQYEQALQHFETAIPILEKINAEADLAGLYKKTADIYAKQSFYRRAFDYYRLANPLLKKTGQLQLYGESLTATGNLIVNFSIPKNAINFYKRALVIKENLHDMEGVIISNTMISKIYFSDKNYDSALYYNNIILRLAKDNKEATAEAMIQQLVLLTFLKKMDQAEKIKQLVVENAAIQADDTKKIKLLAALVNYSLMKNDKVSAKKYFDSARLKITGTHNAELAISGLGQMAEIHYHNGDYKEAYNTLASMDKYKDNFRNEYMDRLNVEIRNAAEASLNEKEIAFLNLNNKLKTEQISKEEWKRLSLFRENLIKDSSLANQKLLMNAMSYESELRKSQLEKERALSISLGNENLLKQKLLNDERYNKRRLWLVLGGISILGSIIFIQYKRQRKKNRIISKQSVELEVLNKEIHHRVKNNLQVISSMLDLQTQTVNDPKATAILKEGMQRVQSMAFIHQNLYQGNSVNSVNMQEYIKILSDHLFQTYNIRAGKIRLHTSIEDIQLHTDSAIPLGMILNELISNALKYAFKNRDAGNIWIALKKNQQELLLEVKDDGIGLPKGFHPDQTNSFGYGIIKAFSQKLKARINLDGSSGTDVKIIIAKFKTISEK